MFQDLIEVLHRLMHMVVWVHTPNDHRWMLPIFTLVLVIAPAWMAWHVLRFVLSSLKHWKGRTRTGTKLAPPVSQSSGLERFVLRATAPFQIRLVIISVLTIPATYILLLLPKHIINHALDEDGPKMDFLGLSLGSGELLFALCASYLVILTVHNLIKYAANVIRGRVNERIVRRIRLWVIRRRREERGVQGRSTLAAVAIHECEPIGYFGGSLLVVPLIYGGTLLTSLVFLLLQDVALALAAVMMLPLQMTVLPQLQQRINAKVRERVHATRRFNAALTHETAELGASGHDRPAMRDCMRQAKALERVRLDIAELKSRLKSLYNYTSNLTPFFFFAIGGYLVLQQRLSLGALVAALAAYREIAPSLRELFDFAQNWSDARARYAEVIAAINSPQEPQARETQKETAKPRLRLVEGGSAPYHAAGTERQ